MRSYTPVSAANIRHVVLVMPVNSGIELAGAGWAFTNLKFTPSPEPLAMQEVAVEFVPLLDFMYDAPGGKASIELPPGKYWGVARFKADGTYGPLLPGDKHSGEPLEIDMIGGNAEVEFVVADIMELGQKKRAAATDAIRLKGRVLDRQGQPLANAMVFAGRTSEYVELPEFVSAWTEGDGRYELFLPPGGSYRVGATLHYPLVKQEPPPIMLAVDSNKIDIAIDMDLTVK